MRLTFIAATDLLSFSRINLDVPAGLSVIVGPNGSGKTNLGRLVRLATAAVRAAADGDFAALEQAWALAGRYGSSRFEVQLGLAFDEAELSVIEDWARAALLTAFELSDAREVTRHDRLLPRSLRAADLLAAGKLIVCRDDRRSQPWTVCWQSDDQIAHMNLGHDNTLKPGPLADEGTGHDPWKKPQDLVLSPGPFPGNRSPEEQKTWEAQYESNLSSFTLTDIVDAGSPVRLTARRSNSEPEPLALHRLITRFPMLHRGTSGYLTFAHVLDDLVSSALAVTDNRRLPVTTNVEPDHLNGHASLEDGSGLAIELLRLKNGDAAARGHFRAVQDVFDKLTGRHLDVRQQASGNGLLITPVVVDIDPATGREVDLPLHLTGAGVEESAWLSTLLTSSHHTLVLDEPASNVSAVAQRRLLQVIQGHRRGRQTILITHSADLVPVQDASELSVVTRLSRRGGETAVHRPRLGQHEFEELKELLRHAQLRSLLFAAGVVLVEGPTEVDAFETWLARVDEFGLPTPESSHVVFLSVGGDERFPKHAQLMELLGVPYAIVADGPAFVPGKALSKLPQTTHDIPGISFAEAVTSWAPFRVRTLAAEFGVGERKGRGEIEAFFETVDADLWDELSQDAGRKDKPLLGYRFASRTGLPRPVVDLWRNLCHDLGLDSDQSEA